MALRAPESHEADRTQQSPRNGLCPAAGGAPSGGAEPDEDSPCGLSSPAERPRPQAEGSRRRRFGGVFTYRGVIRVMRSPSGSSAPRDLLMA